MKKCYCPLKNLGVWYNSLSLSLSLSPLNYNTSDSWIPRLSFLLLASIKNTLPGHRLKGHQKLTGNQHQLESDQNRNHSDGPTY